MRALCSLACLICTKLREFHSFAGTSSTGYCIVGLVSADLAAGSGMPDPERLVPEIKVIAVKRKRRA